MPNEYQSNDLLHSDGGLSGGAEASVEHWLGKNRGGPLASVRPLGGQRSAHDRRLHRVVSERNRDCVSAPSVFQTIAALVFAVANCSIQSKVKRSREGRELEIPNSEILVWLEREAERGHSTCTIADRKTSVPPKRCFEVIRTAYGRLIQCY